MKYLLVAVLLAACTSVAYENGEIDHATLEGSIDIGPICPVETDPPDPNCQPTAETYENFALLQIKEGPDGPFIMTRIVAENGVFSEQIVATESLIVLESSSPGRSNLPISISPKEGEVVTINVSVDTGIRSVERS